MKIKGLNFIEYLNNMKRILRITGFTFAFTFLAWAYFNYPFQFCPSVSAPGEYIPCNYVNMHGFLNAKYYPLGYAVVALAALAAIIYIYIEIDKHRKSKEQK